MPLFDQARLDLKAAAALAAETVTIVPKSGAGITLPARIGSRTFRTYAGAAVVYVVARRFIVEVADLGGYTPANGDKVVWRGRSHRMANPDGGPPWRWHGADRTSVVILATETAAKIGEAEQENA